MEFQEAAVHYAFPIVGVIVCCLLVFAFGFKSPGQPPSFDIVDVERKVVKKRKGKENQKIKPQQNGKVTSAVSTKVEAAPHTPKTKAAAEKQANKSEAKQSNKKSRSQQAAKQVDVKNKSEVVQSEDANEDGWVQQVSKKERKNRKKDDVPNSVDVAKTLPEVEASLPVVESLEKAGSLKEEVIQVEKEKQNDSSDSAVEKEPSEDTNKSTPKAQRTPKKKKGKKEEEVSVESNAAKELPVPEIPVLKEQVSNSESKSYSPVSNSNAVIEPPADDLLQVQEIAEVSEEEVKSKSKKKKSKKKNQETADVENVKSETKSVNAQEHNEVVEQQTVPKKEIIIEPKLIEVELQDGDKKDMSNEPLSAPGSNVAFDELKDLCPEEKPQKKKKKVRREH